MTASPIARITYLDSSRGVAALIVLLAHFQLTILPSLSESWIFLTPLRFIFDAEAAVLYFFILSGFVLTRSLDNIEKLTMKVYTTFVIKRIYRIYPAFLIAFLVTLFVLVFTTHPSNGWLSQFWQNETNDFTGLLKQIILVKRIPNDPLMRILPHDWTLSIEMAVSLLLPVLAFASRFNSFLTLAFVYLSVKLLGLDPFAFDFSLGIFLARKRHQVESLNKSQKLILGFTAILLICSDYILPGIMKNMDHMLIHHKSWGLFFALILILTTSRIQQVLSIKPLEFLGKISYSFYLFHFVILLVMSLIFTNINSIAFLIIFLISTILISSICYYKIEKPFIKVSHKLSG